MRHLILALTLTGCGTYEVPETATDDAATSEERDETQTDERDTKTSQSVSVTTETNVTVIIGDEADAADWRFVERRRTHADAVAETPDGYRLPTRLELMQAHEDGKFDGYTSEVWTSDEADDRPGYFYFVSLDDADSFAYPAGSLFATVYVRDSGE